MKTYKVTLELKTPWWKKVFRFFKFISPRKEFELIFTDSCKYEVNDIIKGGEGKVRILEKVKAL